MPLSQHRNSDRPLYGRFGRHVRLDYNVPADEGIKHLI